jgi:hypothetical protein
MINYCSRESLWILEKTGLMRISVELRFFRVTKHSTSDFLIHDETFAGTDFLLAMVAECLLFPEFIIDYKT